MENQPIIVGLAGQALTGKTITGSAFAPLGYAGGYDGIFWSHEYFAHPLYRMAGVLQKVSGDYAFDRKLYEVYDILAELFNRNPLYGAPPWDALVELTRKVVTFPVPPEGEKARTFLQKVGSWCREIQPDCFVDATLRLIKSNSRHFNRELERKEEMLLIDPKTENAYDEPTRYGAIISDVRYRNEADKILAEPQGILIKLTADESVRNQRALGRDGKLLSDEQKNHESELGILDITDELCTAVVDTSNLSVAEQFAAVKKVIYEQVGVYA